MAVAKTYKGYIFDLDNTLYKDPVQKNALYALAATLAAVEVGNEMGLSLNQNEMNDVVQRSIAEHRSELTLLLTELGMDRATIFRAYHRSALDVFISNGAFVPHHPTIDAIRQSTTPNMVILTHASREWAEKVVELLGLQDVFPPERIIALDDENIDFSMKSASETPFREALKVLQCEPEEVAVFEDSSNNLHIPRAMGMDTVLITWDGLHTEADMPQVDYIHGNVGAFIAPRGAAADMLPALAHRRCDIT